MPISEATASFAAALDAARAELGEVETKITALENERHNIERAPPHTEDIVAVFMRGLQDAEKEFERQFTAHLKARFVGSDGKAAAAAAKASKSNILRMEAELLTGQAVVDRARRGEVAALNDAVLTFLLRDKIAAEIPALVDRLCPSARNGMKMAERDSRIDALDEQLAELRRQRASLQADLNAARAAVIR